MYWQAFLRIDFLFFFKYKPYLAYSHSPLHWTVKFCEWNKPFKSRTDSVREDWTVGAHHEGVLHSDDAAVQDGGRHWGDLQHFPAPRFRLSGGKGLPPQVGDQLLDLLHLPFGVEGLGLVNGCLWHHHTGGAVLDLRKNLNRFSCKRMPHHHSAPNMLFRSYRYWTACILHCLDLRLKCIFFSR